MTTLYAFSNRIGGIVVGTGNAAEIAVGYGTKYGDEGVDVQPIGMLLKCEVRAVAKAMDGMPQQIIDQAPSAGLWEGQTDEEELGVSYDDIDKTIDGYGGLVVEANYKKIKKMQETSCHKRTTPPILKVPTLQSRMVIRETQQMLGIKTP
jgi:NAD+ synthase